MPKRSSPMLVGLVWLVCSQALSQELKSNRVLATPYDLNELKADFTVPGGYKVATQRWIPLTPNTKGMPYNGGTVFVVTGRPGDVVRIMWTVLLVQWEKQDFQQHDKVFVVEFAGKKPPETPDDRPTPDPDRKPVRVTWVYERLEGIVPRYVQAALQKLNSQGIDAHAIDKDQRDGDNQIPDQFKVALEHARNQGVPILVVEFDDRSSSVSKPTTERQVLKEVLGTVNARLDRLERR